MNKTIKKNFSLLPKNVEMLKILLEDEGIFLSDSDIVRRAIEDFFYAKRPKYIFERSATDTIKREQLKEEKSFERMDDMEYAKSLKGLILDNRKGEPHLIIFTLGTGLRCIPIKDLKKWVGNEMFDAGIEAHKFMVNDGAKFQDRLPSYANEFSMEFDVDVQSYLQTNQ